mgnify:CR=1 FL=1
MIEVSIIIPTYNRLQFIYPTILCLINQKTDLTYEIVVVDAGIDETEKIISSNSDWRYGSDRIRLRRRRRRQRARRQPAAPL